jgi:hypothetical protein
MELNGWTSPQMLTRYGASARGARRSYDRIMDDSTCPGHDTSRTSHLPRGQPVRRTQGAAGQPSRDKPGLDAGAPPRTTSPRRAPSSRTAETMPGNGSPGEQGAVGYPAPAPRPRPRPRHHPGSTTA